MAAVSAKDQSNPKKQAQSPKEELPSEIYIKESYEMSGDEKFKIDTITFAKDNIFAGEDHKKQSKAENIGIKTESTTTDFNESGKTNLSSLQEIII